MAQKNLAKIAHLRHLMSLERYHILKRSWLGNSLDTLSHFALLDKLENVLAIDMSMNAMKSLELSELEMFENLRYLNLARNQIRHIYRTRQPINHLELLDLSGNHLLSLTNSTFEGLSALKHLDLSSNSLSQLGTHCRIKSNRFF